MNVRDYYKNIQRYLRVKLVSYEKNRPELFSATLSSAENSISIFFCQI